MMIPWRTTFGQQAAIWARMAIDKVSYGELMRRALAAYLTGDQFHDFEAQPMVYGANVFPDSQFDPDSRV